MPHDDETAERLAYRPAAQDAQRSNPTPAQEKPNGKNGEKATVLAFSEKKTQKKTEKVTPKKIIEHCCHLVD